MSGQNYIGSKISLISLSDIRYVGILHSINSAESTVALQNVQSFGTEGRKSNPNEEIDPSSNIFDYVVFRGSDIKDLQVFEAPPSYKSDPVTIEHQQAANPHDKMQYGLYNPPLTPAYENYWQRNSTAPQNPFSYHVSQQQFQQNFPSHSIRMPVPENYQQESVFSSNVVGNMRDEKTVDTIASEKGAPTDFQEKQEVAVLKNPIESEEKENSIVDLLAKEVSELDIKASELSGVTQSRVFKQQQQHQRSSAKTTTLKEFDSVPSIEHTSIVKKNGEQKIPAHQIKASNETTGNLQKSSGNRRRRSNGVNKSINNNTAAKPDFDFALANAKFEKGNIKDCENAKSEVTTIPDHGQFYDKKKSFFDDISCESKEYGKGNRGKNHQEERKLNLETFGVANSSSGVLKEKRHRPRNRGKGRKYRENGNDNTSKKDRVDRVIKEDK